VTEPQAQAARVCIVSLREVNRQAAWCSNYEFEDVICDIEDADLVSLMPGAAHDARQWLARRLIWRRGLRQLTPLLNPGLQRVALGRDYDLLVFICMNPADLIYLSALQGWKARCRRSVCVMVEFYSGWRNEYAHHMSLLRAFDQVALCFGGSVEAVRALSGRPCHHVALGVDVLRFTPYPRPPERCIDIYSFGRRVEAAHESMLRLATGGDFFYLHDTIPGLLVQPRDHRQHRNLLANCAKRSKYFVAYPAKVDVASETRGQSEVGARFFEGAAAGAILIGQAPGAPAFAADFDWPDAVVEIGASDESLHAVLRRFGALPELADGLRRRNAVQALRRFDWSYRWKEILRLAGLQPTERHLRREAILLALAQQAEARDHAAVSTV